MEDSIDSKTRKTITLTHKQAAATGLSMTTFFTILHFLSANYASKSDVATLKEEMVDVKIVIKDGFKSQTELLASHSAEETHKHERIVDTLRKEIADEKTDRLRNEDGESKRIDLVMELFKIKHTKTN